MEKEIVHLQKQVKELRILVMSAALLLKTVMWLDRNIRKNHSKKHGRQVHFKWKLSEV